MPKNNTKTTVLLLIVLLFGCAYAQSCANTQDLSLLLQAGTSSTIQETSRWPIPSPPRLPCPASEPSTFPSATQSLRAASRSPRVLPFPLSLQQFGPQQSVREQLRHECAGRKIIGKSGPAFAVHQLGLLLAQSSPELSDQLARWSLFGELHRRRIPVSELGHQHAQVRLLRPQLEPHHNHRLLRDPDFGHPDLPLAASLPDPPSPRHQNRNRNSDRLSGDQHSLWDALLHLLLVAFGSQGYRLLHL